MAEHSQRGVRYHYRLMSPLGIYPRAEIKVDGATLFVDEQLVALATSEELAHTELLLKAAILLSSQQASDNLKFYAFPFTHQLDVEASSEVVLSSILDDVSQKKQQLYTPTGGTIPEFDWYENAKGASLPPVLGGASYNWFQAPLEQNVIRDLFNRLKQYQCPRLRGALAALLEANQLSCHFQFHPQASAALLDCLRMMQEVEHFHVDSAQLSTLLSQLGDSAVDYLISRRQMAQKIGPIDFHRLFVQSCTQLRKFLLSL